MIGWGENIFWTVEKRWRTMQKPKPHPPHHIGVRIDLQKLPGVVGLEAVLSHGI